MSTIQTALGHAAHVADAAEGLLELVLLAAQDEQLLLRHAALGDVVEVDLLELLEPLEPLVHGLEVGEHAAQPALVDVGHAHAGRLLGDRLLGLLLGADEEDRAAVGDGLLDEVVRAVDERQRLLQVDDVDAVALGEDEALHLGVPAPGLVPEVDAALEELAHRDDGHAVFLLVTASARRAGGRGALGSSAPAGRPVRLVPAASAPASTETFPWGRTERSAPPTATVCGHAKSARSPWPYCILRAARWCGRTAKPHRAPTLKTWTPRLIPRRCCADVGATSRGPRTCWTPRGRSRPPSSRR